MHDWLADWHALRARGAGAIAVVVVATRGSAPREVGARMLVSADAVAGTIGGGHLEWQAIAIARELLASGPSPRLERFSLGATLGQCCGGAVELLFDPMGVDGWAAALPPDRPSAGLRRLWTPLPRTGPADASAAGDAARPRHRVDTPAPGDARAGAHRRVEADGTWLVEPLGPDAPHLVLHGAGHVGRALVRVLAEVPCTIDWVDPREDAFPAERPRWLRAHVDDPVGFARTAPDGAFHLVMTHRHDLDEAIVETLLRAGRFGWLGLIGSATKRRRFEQRLGARGLSAAALARVVCPIGIDGIDGKAPGVVAVSVAAQLLQVFAAAASQPAASPDARPASADPHAPHDAHAASADSRASPVSRPDRGRRAAEPRA